MIAVFLLFSAACGDNGGTGSPPGDDGNGGADTTGNGGADTTGNGAPGDTSGNGGDPSVAEQSCVKNAVLRHGAYALLNNMHGEHRLGEGESYEQCIRKEAAGFPLSWRWELDTAEPYVKGFPQVYFGRHLWTDVVTTDLLPARIEEITSLEVRHEVAIKAEGTYNLAFDLWITADDTPAPEERTHEIMIWIDGNIPVEGDRVAEATIGGDPYDFYRWEHRAGHTFLMFVARTSRPSATTNIHEFLSYLLASGDLPGGGYLTVVELGTEMWDGNGTITVSDFEVTMESGS